MLTILILILVLILTACPNKTDEKISQKNLQITKEDLQRIWYFFNAEKIALLGLKYKLNGRLVLNIIREYESIQQAESNLFGEQLIHAKTKHEQETIISNKINN